MKQFDNINDPEVIRLIKNGGVGVLPTDTVYGLVTSAQDEGAVTRLYELKPRENKPGTLIAANLKQLEQLGLRHRYLKAVEQFWPSPVSIVLPCGAELDYLNQGKGTLAIRIPKHDMLQELLAETGPLLTTSANHPGEPTANTVQEAEEYFNDQIDFYVDGGNLSGHAPSTVLRIVDDAIEILRQGAVKINEQGRIEE